MTYLALATPVELPTPEGRSTQSSIWSRYDLYPREGEGRGGGLSDRDRDM